MPTPKASADQPKPADKAKTFNPDKPKRPLSPPRRKNRFNEREFARAARAGRAVGAERVEVDPATGVISMVLKPNQPDAAGNDLDQWLRDKNARPPERH